MLIDASDESSERERILTLLLRVVGDQYLDCIQILAMSRKELDIKRALFPIATDISLSNPYVDEDIYIYVQGSFRKEGKFMQWPLELTIEIENAIVKSAKGM